MKSVGLGEVAGLVGGKKTKCKIGPTGRGEGFYSLVHNRNARVLNRGIPFPLSLCLFFFSPPPAWATSGVESWSNFPASFAPVHLGLTAQLIDADLTEPGRTTCNLQYSGISDDVGGCKSACLRDKAATGKGSSPGMAQGWVSVVLLECGQTGRFRMQLELQSVV